MWDKSTKWREGILWQLAPTTTAAAYASPLDSLAHEGWKQCRSCYLLLKRVERLSWNLGMCHERNPSFEALQAEQDPGRHCSASLQVSSKRVLSNGT